MIIMPDETAARPAILQESVAEQSEKFIPDAMLFPEFGPEAAGATHAVCEGDQELFRTLKEFGGEPRFVPRPHSYL
jgi:hypothetical protein